MQTIVRLVQAVLVVAIALSNYLPALAESSVQRRELANGLVVLVRERPTAGVVAITAAIRSGSRDDQPGEEGAHVLMARAHLLGTSRWPTEDALRRAVQVTGGSIGQSTDQETTRFTIVVPSSEFDLAAAVLLDVLLSPSFDPTALERARRQQLQDISRSAVSPQSIASRTIEDRVYMGHPAGRPQLGLPGSVAGLTRERVVRLREETFLGSNIVISVVGQVETQRAFAALTESASRLPAGKTPVAKGVPQAGILGTRVDLQAGQQQALVYVAVPTVGRFDQDYFPLLLLSRVLGGSAGRLFVEIRGNRGLAYTATSGLALLTDAGYLFGFAGTDPVNVEQVEALIQFELDRLVSEPIDLETLGLVKSELIGSRRLADDASSSQAERLAVGTLLGSYLTNDEFRAGVEQVTSDDILRVATKYLDGPRLVVVVRPTS